MPWRHHDALLGALGAEHLDLLAEFHRSVAESFAGQAKRKARTALPPKAVLRRFDQLGQLGRLALELAENAGADLDRAVELVARQHEENPETIREHVRRLRQQLDAESRDQRDRRIMIRARKGWQNVRIAEAEGLSANQVGRILKRMKSAAGRASVDLARRRAERRKTSEERENAPWPTKSQSR